jgi:hypothetical protein
VEWIWGNERETEGKELVEIVNEDGRQIKCTKEILKRSDFLDFSSIIFFSLNWCIVDCRIPSDENLRKSTK